MYWFGAVAKGTTLLERGRLHQSKDELLTRREESVLGAFDRVSDVKG
jgi:hypothetical protein